MNRKTLYTLSLAFTFAAAIAAAAFARPPRHDGRGGPPPFEKMDTDKDGKISKAEWEADHAKRFSEMDKNGDGFLDKDEMRPPRRMREPAGKEPAEK